MTIKSAQKYLEDNTKATREVLVLLKKVEALER